jgi:hypothetical protein
MSNAGGIKGTVPQKMMLFLIALFYTPGNPDSDPRRIWSEINQSLILGSILFLPAI